MLDKVIRITTILCHVFIRFIKFILILISNPTLGNTQLFFTFTYSSPLSYKQYLYLNIIGRHHNYVFLSYISTSKQQIYKQLSI